MITPIIFIAVGLLGLGALFLVQFIQSRTNKKFTDTLNTKFEGGLKVGKEKTSQALKIGIKKTGEGLKKGAVSGVKKITKSNFFRDIFRGKREIGESNGNGSKFLNDVREARDEVRGEITEKRDSHVDF